MRRRWIVLAATMVAALASVLFGASSPVQAATADRWGFAFVANPLVPIWTNLPAQQAGTWPAGFVVQGGRIAPGRFLVKFPQSASGARGNVHITPVNRTGHYCEIVRWNSSGTDEIVDVQCHRVGGMNDDTPFTVLWTLSSGVLPAGSVGSYASVQYGPAAIVQAYNSTGAPVTVVPAGVGVYQVRFVGVGSGVLSGNVQATAVHPNAAPRRCNIMRWGTVGLDAIAYVACRDQTGTLVNSEFTASYHRERSVIASFGPPKMIGYVVTNAGGQTNFNYPSGGFGFNSWFAVAPVGRVLVKYPNLGFNPTHAQVTAQVDNANYCTLTQPWSVALPDAQVDVICYNNAGVTTATPFFSTFTSRD